MKRTDFLQLLKENNQAAIQLAITNALEQNENLNLYDDVTEFTHTPLLDAVTEGCDAAVTLLLETKKVLVDVENVPDGFLNISVPFTYALVAFISFMENTEKLKSIDRLT